MIVPFSTLGVALLLTHAASASPAGALSEAYSRDTTLEVRTANAVSSSASKRKACTDRIKQRKLQSLCKLALAQFKNQGCDYSKGPLPNALKSFLAPYTNQIIVEACAAALGTTIPSCVTALPSPSTFQYCANGSACQCSQSDDQRTVTCYYPVCIRDGSAKISRECFNERVDVFNVPTTSPGGKLYIQASGGSSGDVSSGALLYGSFDKVRSGQVKLTVGSSAPSGSGTPTAGGPDGGRGSAQIDEPDAAPNGIGGGGSTTIDCSAVSDSSCYVVAAGAGGAGQSIGSTDDGSANIITEPGTDADSTDDDSLLTDSMQGESGQDGLGQGGGGGGYRGGRAGSSSRAARGGRAGRAGFGGRSFGPAAVTKALCRDSSTTQFNTRCGDAYVSYTI